MLAGMLSDMGYILDFEKVSRLSLGVFNSMIFGEDKTVFSWTGVITHNMRLRESCDGLKTVMYPHTVARLSSPTCVLCLQRSEHSTRFVVKCLKSQQQDACGKQTCRVVGLLMNSPQSPMGRRPQIIYLGTRTSCHDGNLPYVVVVPALITKTFTQRLKIPCLMDIVV